MHPNTHLYFHAHSYVYSRLNLDSITHFYIDVHVYCYVYLFSDILPISLVLRKCLAHKSGNISLGEQLAIAMLSQLSYNSVGFLQQREE